MTEASSAHSPSVAPVTPMRMEVYVEGRLVLRECAGSDSETGALVPQLHGGESMTGVINGRPWIVRMRPRLTARAA